MDVKSLKEHLQETPKDELKKEWEEVKQFEDVGPKVIVMKDYFEKKKRKELIELILKNTKSF